MADVVAPGQEEHAGVVFLPVREYEREKHDPEEAIECEHGDSALATAEHRVHGAHEENTRPAVQAMVKQLTQRGARVRPASLLPIDTVYTHTALYYSLTASRL